MTVRIAVAGALGRMGRAVLRAARETDGLDPIAGFDRPGWSDGDSEGVHLLSPDEALAAADVVIDFTAPAVSVDLAAKAAELGRPALVVGTTGLTDAQEADLARAAQRIAIVHAGNFSLGVNVLLGLVAQAARRLDGRDWDAEVFEAHHRRKVDAPSGTALMLGEAIAAARGVSLHEQRIATREGVTEPREPGAIGFSVLRGGGIVGDHSVTFAAEDELITLSHSARDRSLFARGALAAAHWVADKPPGLYDMQDVLGFEPQP